MCVLTLIHQLHRAAELLFCPVSCKNMTSSEGRVRLFLCHLFFPPRKTRKAGLPITFSLSFLPSCLFSVSLPLADTIFILRGGGKKKKDLLQRLVMKRLCLNPDRRLDALKSYSDNHKIWTKKSHYRGFRRFSCSKLPARPL